MTASNEAQHRTKRSKGFTIDSIIGSDSDRQTDRRSTTPDHVHVNKPTDNSPRDNDTSRRDSVDPGSDSDRTPNRRDSDFGARERQFEHERLRRKDHLNHSPIGNGNIERTISSLHRDAVRDLNFSTSRDGLQTTPTSSDTLKYFHETLMQNAAAAAAAASSQGNPAMNIGGMGSPFGHFDAQRHCRHPLSGLNIPGYPSPLPAHPTQLPPGVLLPGGGRDIRQMYPYIADRYPGYFHPRFGLGGMPGLFFQPYRKPKRIRTAFSPSQLLQLEKSFEKSHYVVGQERKDLASELQLSETQVKVWFQNRRTKYKRSKAEQDGGSGERGEPGSPCHESNEESDISDIDDIDDVGGDYISAHAYGAPIQTC